MLMVLVLCGGEMSNEIQTRWERTQPTKMMKGQASDGRLIDG